MRTLLELLAARPGEAWILLLASLLIHLLGMSGTLFVILVFNNYLPHGVDATLLSLAAGACILALLEFALREARKQIAGALSEGSPPAPAALGALVRSRLGALEALPAGARHDAPRALEQRARVLVPAFVNGLLDLPFAALYLAALYLLSIPLGLIASGAAALLLALGLGQQRALGRAERGLAAVEQEARAAFVTALDAPEALRAFNWAQLLEPRWRVRQAQAAASRLALLEGQETLQHSGLLVLALLGLVVTSVGAWLAFSGALSVGALIGANLFAARAAAPLLRLLQTAHTLAEADAASARLAALARLPREPEGGTALSAYSGRLELADAAFAYPGSPAPLFERLSLVIEPGSLVTVIGPNGSGKSTLLQMLAGLREPLRGRVLAEGVDLRQLAPPWWRERVGYVPQEPLFFDGSVRENLACLAPGADAARLNEATRAAGLLEWLDRSPRGFDTPIVEGGRQLAFGVRKRLALARAYLASPALYLLDEPSEGLDEAGRAALYAALNELYKSGATLVVASADPAILCAARVTIDLGAKPVPRLVYTERLIQAAGV